MQTMFCVNEKSCNKHKISLTEILIVLALRSADNINEIINGMLEKEILVEHDNQYYVTQHWNDVVDEVLAESMGGPSDEERLLRLAKAMRECFPEGKMPGTAYYYRCNNREVILKLKKFFAQYGDYSDEKIIDACKRFVAAFNGNYRYMPLIKYFISKNKSIQDEDGSVHVVEVSQLADYLENKESKVGVVTNSDDWLLSARN